MKLGNDIIKVFSADTDSFEVDLLFKDGFRGRASLKEIFSRPKGLVTEVLRGDFFGKCFVESGALAWPNGLELCPDVLRQMAESQRKINSKKAA